MMDLDKLAEKYGVPERPLEVSVDAEIGKKLVTRAELIEAIQAVQGFAVASSALAVAAHGGDKATDAATEKLFAAMGKTHRLVLKLLEIEDGQH